MNHQEESSAVAFYMEGFLMTLKGIERQMRYRNLLEKMVFENTIGGRRIESPPELSA